ncbi:alpha/beta hydrolase [Bdellovibrio sp. HCB2-146]|uniref:alpha/beta hydrolase n=1 Tax=Bdellovibrio sp. HCB2-146 TaxID=3394362 RepID=UPI0039BD56B2
MIKLLLITLVTTFTTTAFAAKFDGCVAQFNSRVQQRISKGVPTKHLPRLYLPAYNPKQTVVIFTHGMFESPYFFKGINKVFQDQGFVSISILLPGHWQGDWSNMKKVSYREWQSEIRENIKLAQCFGKKVIFAGHSLGGLLSMDAALANPGITEGVLLWSPAVDVRASVSIGGFLGGLLHLNGNTFFEGAANLDETPLYSPNAAKQMSALIKNVRETHGNGTMKNVYGKIKAPTFLAYAERDPAVDVDEITRAAYSISGLSKEYTMYFPETTHVWHGNITKNREDVYKKAKWDYNLKWESMQARVESFMRKFY